MRALPSLVAVCAGPSRSRRTLLVVAAVIGGLVLATLLRGSVPTSRRPQWPVYRLPPALLGGGGGGVDAAALRGATPMPCDVHAFQPADGAPFVAVAVHAASQERLEAALETWAVGGCYRLTGPAPVHCAPACVQVALLFFTSNSDVKLPTAWPSLVLPATWDGGEKTFAALRALLTAYPRARWYFKADDDTFVVFERLAAVLVSNTARCGSEAGNGGVPCIVGASMHRGIFASGGAGYGFPAWVLRAIVTYGDICQVSVCRAPRARFRRSDGRPAPPHTRSYTGKPMWRT